jgi:hypothetical protein
MWASHRPSFFVDSAWNLPGSYQMSIARSVLEKYQWYDFSPAPELLKNTHSSFVPISFSNKYLMLYLPKAEDHFLIDTRNFIFDSNMIFIHPISGNEFPHAITYQEPGYCLISKPDTNDWIAVFPIVKTVNHIGNNPTKLLSDYFVIDRFVQYGNILRINLYYLGRLKKIVFRLYTVGGRLLTSQTEVISSPGYCCCRMILSKSHSPAIGVLRVSDANHSQTALVNIK